MNSNKVNSTPEDYLDDYAAFNFIVNSLIDNVNTVEVVKVVKVNNDNTIDVIPIVKRLTSEGETIGESVVYGVKCFGWQYGVNAIKAKPVVDDIGFVVVSKRDISSIESGRVASNRKYCLADGIYVGGLVGFNQEPTEIITFDDNGISIKSTKDIKVEGVNIEAKASVNAKIDAPVIELGAGAVNGVARYGDTVEVGGIQGTITSASAIVKAG